MADPGLSTIEGVPPSAEIRQTLAEQGRPVLLAFSRGKDSIAAWLALRDAGVEVVPYHMYAVPGLQFVEESLAYFEDYFSTPIARYPHPSLFRLLNNFVFQAPERLAVLEAADLPNLTYEEMLVLIREDLGVAPDTWVADGVRAADSPVRRIAFARYGAMKASNLKVSPVWDWKIAKLRAALAEHQVQLPPEYEWFGRSFDGIDYRFLEPLSREAPQDFQRILDWFPLAEMELFRHDL